MGMLAGCTRRNGKMCVTYDPGARAPRACKEENVDADECDQRVLSGLVFASESCANTGDDELAYSHSDGPEEQEWATTPGLDHVETRESGCHVNGRGNHADQEGVLDAGSLEERSSVVENEVHAEISLAIARHRYGVVTYPVNC
jgi:hypothetical protein